MTETASQLSAPEGGAPPPSPPPVAETVKQTLPQMQVKGWKQAQLGQAQAAMQATTKAKPVGQLSLLKAYPTKRPPQVAQQEELADPWTELPELPMCAVTSPRVSSSKTKSQPQQQRQRSRLSYEQWLLAKNKADAQQRRRQRREQQRQRHEQLQRQQLAAHSFKLWLKGKQRQQSLPRVAAGSAVSSSSKNAALQQDVASRRYVQMWQRRKLAELATQRESQQQRQQQQQLRNELRRQLSDLAFERWLAQSAVKRQLKLGSWRAHQQQQQQAQQRKRQPQQQQQQQQQQQHQRPPRQQRQPLRQQRKADAEDYSLYLHVPLSAAQQALRDRLQDIHVMKAQPRRRY